MTRIKILHLITELVVGGAQDNTLETIARLDRNKYEVHLASNPRGAWQERGASLAEVLFIIPSMRRDVSPLSDVKALAEIVRLIRRQRYDIVHTHSSKAGVLGRVAARMAGAPLVVHTVHGLPWHPQMPAARRAVFQTLERLAARFSDHIITVSDNNREEMLGLGLAPAGKMTTIYSGVDLAQFPDDVSRFSVCDRLQLDPRRPIVGVVARLSPQKAPLDMLSAARIVADRCPQAQFVFVGDGPLREDVEAAARELPNVNLLGARDDVPQLLPVFDVFALSSRWEGIGRALTEAMIVGLPVAVTAVDGVPEVVRHGETGLLSPPARPDLLAANIIRLLEEPRLAQRLGQNARAFVRPRFDSRIMVRQIDELYQSLLPASTAQPSNALPNPP